MDAIKISLLIAPEFELPVILKDSQGRPCFEIRTAGSSDPVLAQLPPHFQARHLSESEWFSFFLGAAASIPTGLVTSYLYDLLKSRKVLRVQIDGVDVEADAETIAAVLEHACRRKS